MAAGVTAQPLLGHGFRAASHVLIGLVICVPFLVAAAELVGWESDEAVFGSLLILSLLFSWAPLPQLSAKLALSFCSITLMSGRPWPKSGYGTFDSTFSARMSLAGVVGVAVGLAIISLPFWPQSRACRVTASALTSGEKAAASLVELMATSAFPRPDAQPGAAPLVAAVRLRADALRSAANAALTTVRTLGEGVRWEVRVLGPQVAPPALAKRTAALAAHLLMLDGLLAAWDAAEAASEQHQVISERRKLMRIAHLHASPGTSILASSDPPAGTEEAAEDEEIYEANTLLQKIAPAAGRLAAASAAAILSSAASTDAASCFPLSGAQIWSGMEGGVSASRVGSAQAAARVRDELDSFDRQLQQSRLEVYYTTSSRHSSNADAFSQPPVEQHAFLFFLRAIAERAAADALAASEVAARPAEPPAVAAGNSRSRLSALAAFLLPSKDRVVYGLKLTLATLIAAVLGQLTCGSGQWSAIAVQIVGARDGFFLGGGFRTANQRAAGTAAGAFFVACLLAVAEVTHAFSVSSLAPVTGEPTSMAPLLAPLAIWATFCSWFRYDATMAYGAMVSSYTGFIILMDPASTAPSTGTGKGSSFVAYRRLEQNVLGLLCWAAVELLILPQRASAFLRPQLAQGLRATADACNAVWAHALVDGGGGNSDGGCDVSAAVGALTAAAAKLSVLLSEMEGEPGYNSATVGDLAAWRRLVTPRLAPLLQAMALCTGEGSFAGMEGLAEHLRPPLRSLLGALCRELDILARWVEAPAAGSRRKGVPASPSSSSARVGEAAAHEAAHEVGMALRKMEMTYSAAGVEFRLRIGDRLSQQAMPPSLGIMALHALMLCTRSLVGVVREVARDVRALAPPDAGLGEEEEDERETKALN